MQNAPKPTFSQEQARSLLIALIVSSTTLKQEKCPLKRTPHSSDTSTVKSSEFISYALRCVGNLNKK